MKSYELDDEDVYSRYDMKSYKLDNKDVCLCNMFQVSALTAEGVYSRDDMKSYKVDNKDVCVTCFRCDNIIIVIDKRTAIST